MSYTSEIAIQMCQHYLDEGVDVIVPVDPVVSQISPANFTKLLLTLIRKYLIIYGERCILFLCMRKCHPYYRTYVPPQIGFHLY